MENKDSYYKRLAKKNKNANPEIENLENNSYYDIDIIEKLNAPIRKKINKLIIEQSNASSWLGKWYWQIRIDKLYKKIHKYEPK